MANVITDVKWHDNPRPVASYATSVYGESVPSPYYKDGRNVPVVRHFITPEPLPDLTPRITIEEAGPSPVVAFTMEGLSSDLQGYDFVITRTDGLDGDYIDTIFHSGPTVGPVEAAKGVASVINEQDDMEAVAINQTVQITAVAPVTSLTIVTAAPA